MRPFVSFEHAGRRKREARENPTFRRTSGSLPWVSSFFAQAGLPAAAERRHGQGLLQEGLVPSASLVPVSSVGARP